MPWLSLPAYARVTGTPESTVRALIRKGTLRAELEQRAPGDPRTVWRVWHDEPQNDPQPAADVRVDPESPQPPAATTEPPALTLRLFDKLDERDAQVEMLSAENAGLRERIGRAEAQVESLTEQLERARARRWWRFWA